MTDERRRRWLDWLIVIAVILGCTSLAGVALELGFLVRHTVLVLLVAAILSVLLSPVVRGLQRQGAGRSLAVALVVAATLIVISALALVLLRPLVVQLNQLVDALPTYVSEVRRLAPQWQAHLGELGIQVDVSTLWAQLSGRIETGGAQLLSGVVGVVSQIGAFAADLVLVAVLTIYLLLDGPRLAQSLRAWVPASQRPRYDRVRIIVDTLLGKYLRGQLLLALILGCLAGFGTLALGVPYAAVIGVAAGLFELIPMAGPVLGAIPAVLLALLVSWRTALYVLIYFVVIQQLEGHVLAPRITGQAVGLRPSMAIIALLGGYELAGLWGALFAVPAVGILGAIVAALWGPAAREGDAADGATSRRARRRRRMGSGLPPLVRSRAPETDSPAGPQSDDTVGGAADAGAGSPSQGEARPEEERP